MKRTPEEERLILGISLCVGAHWKAKFIPEADLLEATNEFWAILRCGELFQLIKDGEVQLDVADKATRERIGHWLRFRGEGLQRWNTVGVGDFR